MASALDRQIRPIYDALDTNSPKSALNSCTKLLKKNPNNVLVKALKSLALLRLQKVEECLFVLDQILPTKPTNDSVLTALMHVLRGLGRNKDVVTMFENAYKQEPANEDLAIQVFLANTRVHNWKAAQQAATKMYKQFQDERYLYWSVMSAILQANDRSTPENLRKVLFQLAHRLITSGPSPPYNNTERFHLHLTVVRELQLWDEADKLLTSDVGKTNCATSLACEDLRRAIWQQRGLWTDNGEIAKERIVEKTDRNWLEFLAILDATFSSKPQEVPEKREECLSEVDRTRSFFQKISEKDGKRDRSGPLALLELEHRAREHGVSQDKTKLVNLMQEYFNSVGDKACCFEDLQPYISSLPADEHSQWTTFLQSLTLSTDDVNSLQQLINVYKFTRYSLTPEEQTSTAEESRGIQYLQKYFEGLPLGENLPSTELQPVDDLALLAGTAFVNAWSTSQDFKYLYEAVSVLEFALSKSKQCFQARVMLVRIYRLLGCSSLAMDHYRALNIKSVQQDTLSHFILSRASTFSSATNGDLTMLTETYEAAQIYNTNSTETADFIGRAFQAEKYSQIPEFIKFEDRLEQSLQRDIVRTEQAKMRWASEIPTTDAADMELIDFKVVLDRDHHDNRDFAILPNYQPRSSPSFEEQTRLFGKVEYQGWLWAFVHYYVEVLQQGSDLCDIVEEKLLVGDRRKPGPNDPVLKNAFSHLEEGVYKELTEDEKLMIDFIHALTSWLGPHHDHVRPGPAQVLAEASKLSQAKTGHALQGIELTPSENGVNKKDKEPPVVHESPSVVNEYFKQAGQRAHQANESDSITSLLHVAGLMVESFTLLYIDTLRFKSSTTIKIHKLGNLAQNCKTLRSDAHKVLREVSQTILKRAETEATAESRKAFATAVAGVKTSSIDDDYLLNIGKQVTESRKKALEGAGKGMTRVCSIYKNLL